MLGLTALINPRTFFAVAVAVCTGTQNFLSTTGELEIQYNLTKKIYTGCEIVMGNLEITMMEEGVDFSFLRVSPCGFGQQVQIHTQDAESALQSLRVTNKTRSAHLR